MWKDDRIEMLDILNDIQNKQIKFPTMCPMCGQLSAHVMFYCYNNSNRRGGIWI